MRGWVAAVAFALCIYSAAATAQQFNQFIGFGDSTVDSGWYRNPVFPTGNAAVDAALPGAVAQGGGLSTTGPGPVSSQVLASDFGLNGSPANQGGANFATGGARNNQAGTLPNAVPTVTQIQNYLAAGNGVANTDALYLIGSGGNDISLYVGQVGAATITLAQGVQEVVQSANDLVAAISRLHAAGARYIVVRSQEQSFGTATEQNLRNAYNNALWWGLASAGVNFIPSDINAVILAVTASPQSFGFIPNAGAACTAAVLAQSILLCTPQTLVAPDAAQTHLLADAGTHFSTAGQKIIADYEYSLITAPSMMSMLAEAPLQTRATLVGAIRNQISATPPASSNRFSTWVTGDVSSLKLENYAGFPNDPGTPAMLSAGFSYRLPENWLIGVALATGRQVASFGVSFGSFTQEEFAGSLYVARGGRVWFDAIAICGTLDYDTIRTVPIGITVQSNSGSTRGSNLSFAGEGGLNLSTGTFTHGPVVGMTLQRVSINAFTETGSFTSLAFQSQLRNSAVSELGYQAGYDAGRWRPFTKFAWDHEFMANNREVTASLTTTSAPSYSLPATLTGTDWATATAGTTYNFTSKVTGLMALTGVIARQGVATYGGELGLNVSF